MKNKVLKYDRLGMRKVILDFPTQFKVGIEEAKKANLEKFLKKEPKNIIICGMGGSALPGDLLLLFNEFLLLTQKPIFIHRDYGLPKEAGKNSLIFTISYSGNTEETLSAFMEARKKNFKTIAIASGGKLIELSKKYSIPFAQIPSGIQPRCALGYQFSALFEFLSRLKVIKKLEKELIKLEKILLPQNLEKKGKRLAQKLLGKIPLIYSSRPYSTLARIWKIKFNENSKIPAFFNVLPELNHNEMTGIGECKEEKLRKIFEVLILQDKKIDYERTQKRMKILSQIFKKRKISVSFIEIEGNDIFEKVFSSIILADWTSFYLALLRKIDPTPVKLVEEFKARMKK